MSPPTHTVTQPGATTPTFPNPPTPWVKLSSPIRPSDTDYWLTGTSFSVLLLLMSWHVTFERLRTFRQHPPPTRKYPGAYTFSQARVHVCRAVSTVPRSAPLNKVQQCFGYALVSLLLYPVAHVLEKYNLRRLWRPKECNAVHVYCISRVSAKNLLFKTGLKTYKQVANVPRCSFLSSSL